MLYIGSFLVIRVIGLRLRLCAELLLATLVLLLLVAKAVGNKLYGAVKNLLEARISLFMICYVELRVLANPG